MGGIWDSLNKCAKGTQNEEQPEPEGEPQPIAGHK